MAMAGKASGSTCCPEAAASAAASRAWSKAGSPVPAAGSTSTNRLPTPLLRVPETGASVDPLRPDLVADDELARAGGSAEELLRGLVVLSGAHSFCPSPMSVLGMMVPRWCHHGRGCGCAPGRSGCARPAGRRCPGDADLHLPMVVSRSAVPLPSSPTRISPDAVAVFEPWSAPSGGQHPRPRHPGRHPPGYGGGARPGLPQVEPGVHVQMEGALGVHVRRSRHGRDRRNTLGINGRSQPTARPTTLGTTHERKPCPTRPARLSTPAALLTALGMPWR